MHVSNPVTTEQCQHHGEAATQRMCTCQLGAELQGLEGGPHEEGGQGRLVHQLLQYNGQHLTATDQWGRRRVRPRLQRGSGTNLMCVEIRALKAEACYSHYILHGTSQRDGHTDNKHTHTVHTDTHLHRHRR